MKFLRQIARGCTNLPHVGEHPGTAFMLIFIAAGAVAGEKGGLQGMAAGALVMACCIGPIYLCGAYSRAQMSDAISEKDSDRG